MACYNPHSSWVVTFHPLYQTTNRWGPFFIAQMDPPLSGPSHSLPSG